jgi:ATP phosphoribosyltransferase-like protein
VLQTFGATEVFPPEDADCLIDNAATGATLRANGLVVVDEVLRSSTRLYANPAAMERREVRERIEGLVVLLRSVLEARRRVMVDLNVAGADLERVVEILPCMREPSVARLHEEGWYAVRAAVPREELVGLIPVLKRSGARDIVTTAPDQIIA